MCTVHGARVSSSHPAARRPDMASAWLAAATLLLLLPEPVAANKTATWLEKRAALIGSVYGKVSLLLALCVAC
eukprot:SAG31_NODE_3043_length_4753_cov_3.006016_5_plen_73_part_00